MLGIALGLLLWTPAIIGWGAAARRLSGRGWRRERLELSDIPAGYLALAGAAMAANFFAGVDAVFSGAALIIGIGFAGFAYRDAGELRNPQRIAAFLAVILIIAFVAAQPVHYGYDPMLYHLQTMQWTRDGAIPTGLANLSGRYGFNSAWLPLAALVTDPFDSRPLEHAILLPGTVACLLVPVTLRCISLARQGDVAGRIALVGVLAIASPAFVETINSTAQDFVPMFAWIACTALLAALLHERDSDTAMRVADIAALAALAIVAKLSAAPIALILAIAVIVAHKRGLSWGIVARGAAVPALVIGLWVARGERLSGCAAYPVAATCSASANWAVSPEQARDETRAIQSWARQPFAAQAAPTPEWIPSWFERHRTNTDLLVPLALILAGLVARFSREGRTRVGVPWVLAAPALLGIAFWASSAPDPRFGAGPLWSLGAVVAAGGGALALSRSRSSLIGWVIIAAAWLPSGSRAVTLLSRPARTPGLARVVSTWHLPIVETPPMTAKLLAGGDTVWTPASARDNRCYLAPTPCTPVLLPGLVIIRDSTGAIVEFRSAR